MYIYNKIPTELLDAIIDREKEFIDMYRDGQDPYLIVYKSEEGVYYLDLCREYITLNVSDVTRIQGIKIIGDVQGSAKSHAPAFY